MNADPFDCQVFHELCMDYRGALATATYNGPEIAYEKLQAYCRGVASARVVERPTIPIHPRHSRLRPQHRGVYDDVVLASDYDALRDAFTNFVQAVTDPENQPSQYGTTLAVVPPVGQMQGKPMNLTIWTGIREYVAAEIALAFARKDVTAANALGSHEDVKRAAAKVRELEEQSTRMETSIREAL